MSDVLVPLSRGLVAVIDVVDAGRICAHKWTANVCKTGHIYAARHENVGGDRRFLRMHRIIMRAPAGMMIDHINGDGLDNRRANLRVATRAQNLQNSAGKKNTASGLKGVSLEKRRSGSIAWRATIDVNGERLSLGSFHTPEEAASAYDAAARKYFGDFARTNALIALLDAPEAK